jgi:RNA 2',3'-cyclic 3'-phosphodiesterase
VRLFVAAAIPESVRREIAILVHRQKSSLPPASWVRPESMHVTFAFIGEQPESMVAPIARALDASATTAASFTARLEGCGFFPTEKRPRVGWVGVRPEEPLQRIAREVRTALKASSVPFDEKPFAPHLTIARMRGGWKASDAGRLSLALSEFVSEEFEMSEVVLYESRLGAGAVYTRQHAAKLPAK